MTAPDVRTAEEWEVAEVRNRTLCLADSSQ